MKTGERTNVAASVRARLLNVSRGSGEDFTYVLTRYGLERLLARLGRSKHREAFTLKGAMLFRIWSPALHRPTKDLDLLGTGTPDVARLELVFQELCALVIDEDDGITFDPKSVRAARIREDAEYEGVRVNLTARLGSVRLQLQVDVGFGDAVTPDVTEVEFPTLLGAPPPKVRAYPRESVVAEKLEDGASWHREQPDEGLLRRLVSGSDLLVRRRGAEHRHRRHVQTQGDAHSEYDAARSHLGVLDRRHQGDSVEGVHDAWAAAAGWPHARARCRLHRAVPLASTRSRAR